MIKLARGALAALLAAALAAPAPLYAQAPAADPAKPFQFRIKLFSDSAVTPPAGGGHNGEEAPTITVPSAFANYRPTAVKDYTVTSSVPGTTYELVGAPPYVSINAATGQVVTTAPSVAVTTNIPPYAIRATPPSGSPVQIAVNNPGVIRPIPQIASSPTGTANVGSPFSHPYAITGSSETTPVADTVGALPPGLSVQPGAISGTPSEAGSYPLVLIYTDPLDGAFSDPVPVTLDVIAGPSFAFRSPASPVGSGRVGEAYSVTAEPKDADGTLAFSNVPTADAPLTLAQTGLSLDALTGEISGFPSAAISGRMNIRMTVTKAGSTKTAENVLNVAIEPPAGGPDLYPVSVTARSKQSPNAVTGNIREVLYDNLAATAGGPYVSGYAGDAAVYTFTYASEVAIQGVAHGITSGTIKVTSLTTGQSREFNASQGLNVNNNQVLGQPESSLGTTLVGSAFEVETQAAANGLRLTQYKDRGQGSRLWSPLVNTVGGLTRYSPYTDPEDVFYTGSYTEARIGFQQYKRINNVDYPVDAELSLAGAAWGLTGDVPPGLTVEDGLVKGIPTQHGDYTFSVFAVQANGIRTLDGTVTMKVRSSNKAQAEYPAISGATIAGGQASATGPLMDADASSYATLAAGATATLTFARPVTADRVTLSAYTGSSTANLELRAADQSSARPAGAVTAKTTFGGPVSSTAWTVRNTGATPANIAGLKLAHGTTPGLTAPSLTGGATPTYVTGSAIAPYQIAKADGYGALTYQHVGGAIPAGLSVNASTGKVEGTPTEVGDFAYQVAATDSLGAQSAWKTLTTTVLSGTTAATKYPLITGLSGQPTSQAATSAAYDSDSSTTVSAAANADLTLTFDEPVTANEVYVGFSSGASGGVYVIPDGGTMLYASGASGTYTLTAPKTARVWTVRVPVAFTAHTLKLRYNGAAPTAPSVSYSATAPQGAAGSAYSYPTTARAGIGAGTTFETSPALPDGLAFDPVTGNLAGTPSSYFKGMVTLTATGPTGIRSVPKQILVDILSGSRADTILPTSVTGGADGGTLARLHDRDANSLESIPVGAVLRYTFDRMVTVTSLAGRSAASRAFEVRNVTEGRIVHSGATVTSGGNPNSTNYATLLPSSGTTFEVRLVGGSGPASFQELALAYASAHPYLPSVNESARFSSGTPTASTYASGAAINGAAPTAGDLSGSPTWAYGGTLPPGSSFDPGTGAVTGSSSVPGTYDYMVAVTDSRGVQSAAKNARIVITP